MKRSFQVEIGIVVGLCLFAIARAAVIVPVDQDAVLKVTKEFDLDMDGVSDRTITLFYDRLDRVVNEIADENSDGVAEGFVTYNYNTKSHLALIRYENGDGMVVKEIHYSYVGSTKTESMDQDADGKFEWIEKTEFDSNGSRIHVQLDINANGAFDQSLHYRNEYSGDNRITESLDINRDDVMDEVTSFTYGSSGELLSVSRDANADGAPEEIEDYRYDTAGKLAFWSLDDYGDGKNFQSKMYEYDEVGRLATELHDMEGDGNVDAVVRYRYEALVMIPEMPIVPAEEVQSSAVDTDRYTQGSAVSADSFDITEVRALGLVRVNEPFYQFYTPMSGYVGYLGRCRSKIRYVKAGVNRIKFDRLKEGVYDDCYIAIMDEFGMLSGLLKVSTFTVDIANTVIEEIDDDHEDRNMDFQRLRKIIRNEYGDKIYQEHSYMGEAARIEKREYDYDENGNIVTEYADEDGDEKPNYIVNYVYDRNGNMTSKEFIRKQKMKFRGLDSYEYTLDRSGRILTKKFTSNYSKNGSVIHSYFYDEEGNRVRETSSWESDNSTYWNFYTFDDKGNEICWGMDWNADGMVDAYFYNTYDAGGNVLINFDDNPTGVKQDTLSKFEYFY